MNDTEELSAIRSALTLAGFLPDERPTLAAVEAIIAQERTLAQAGKAAAAARPTTDLTRAIDTALRPGRCEPGWVLENLLRECRVALATAREDGAREERERIVAALKAEAQWDFDRDSPVSGITLNRAADIASGKHRPS